MTRVEFIFNVEDKLAKAADLCEKAAAKGRQVTIASADADICLPLQRALWQVSAASFLPLSALHVIDSTLAQTLPIHFFLHQTERSEIKLMQDDVLIHFLPDPPNYFSRFRYLVELVGCDEHDKIAARARYKFYRERGYEIKTTDMAA